MLYNVLYFDIKVNIFEICFSISLEVYYMI